MGSEVCRKGKQEREGERGSFGGGVKIKEWGHGLVVDGISLGNGKRASVIVVYSNRGIGTITHELGKLVEDRVQKGESLIITGDFNARIGQLQCQSERGLGDTRRSEDMVINGEGRRLIEFCEAIDGFIRNGNIKGDWEGKSTYVSEGGGVGFRFGDRSRKRGGEGVVDEMVVLPRVESDHLPVAFFMSRQGEVNRGVGCEGVNQMDKLVWDKGKRGDYGREISWKELMGKGRAI